MSKEIKIVAWCDGDHEDDDTIATVERLIWMDQGKPILLDLCDTCDKVMQDLQELMSRGVVADKTMVTPIKKPVWAENPDTPEKDRTCPDGDCGFVAVTRQALGKHVRSKHGKSFKDYPGFRKLTGRRQQ